MNSSNAPPPFPRDLLLPAASYVPKNPQHAKALLPTGDQVFKQSSLQRTFHVLTITFHHNIPRLQTQHEMHLAQF